MSKSAALLLALVLGAGACSTTEPPQTIVALVPASGESTSTSATIEVQAPESSEVDRTEPETTDPTSTTETTKAPSNTAAPESTPAPSTTAAPTATPGGSSLAEILSGSISDDAWAVSARFEGGIEITGNVEGESIEMEMGIAGAFDTATKSMEMSVDMSSIGELLGIKMSEADMEMFGTLFAEPMQMRSIGDTAWIKWSLLDMLTGSEGKWLEMEVDDADFTSGGTSPADLVDILNSLAGEITIIGTDTIAGVPTTHYSITADFNSLSDMMGTDTADFAEYAELLENVPVEIWVDAEGRLRRLEMSLEPDTFTLLLGPTDSFGMSIWYEINAYGDDVVIVGPPAEDVISGDSLSLF